MLRCCAVDFRTVRRDKATTQHSADTPRDDLSRRPTGECPASEDVDAAADELEVLGYDLERALHWSRMRGRHLRAGGSVRWYADGTFVLIPGVAGVGRVITRSGDT